MSDRRGYCDHFQENGAWVQRRITDRRVVDRIATPTRKEARVGQWVTFERRGRQVTGQVWCQGPWRGEWWVAADGEYFSVDERELRDRAA